MIKTVFDFFPQGCIGPAPVRLLALLLDWVVDGQSFPPAAGDREAVLDVPLVVSLHERCSKVIETEREGGSLCCQGAV